MSQSVTVKPITVRFDTPLHIGVKDGKTTMEARSDALQQHDKDINGIDSDKLQAVMKQACVNIRLIDDMRKKPAQEGSDLAKLQSRLDTGKVSMVCLVDLTHDAKLVKKNILNLWTILANVNKASQLSQDAEVLPANITDKMIESENKHIQAVTVVYGNVGYGLSSTVTSQIKSDAEKSANSLPFNLRKEIDQIKKDRADIGEPSIVVFSKAQDEAYNVHSILPMDDIQEYLIKPAGENELLLQEEIKHLQHFIQEDLKKYDTSEY